MEIPAGTHSKHFRWTFPKRTALPADWSTTKQTSRQPVHIGPRGPVQTQNTLTLSAAYALVPHEATPGTPRLGVPPHRAAFQAPGAARRLHTARVPFHARARQAAVTDTRSFHVLPRALGWRLCARVQRARVAVKVVPHEGVVQTQYEWNNHAQPEWKSDHFATTAQSSVRAGDSVRSVTPGAS